LCKTFPPPDNGPTTAQRQPPRKKTRFGALNERALANLDKWVPELFPTAKRTRAGGYRVKSADLGRGLQEDLSITPQGIKYFGVADQGDKRQGRRSPVQLIAEWQHVELPQAAEWLEKMLGSTEQEPPPPEPPEEEAEATDADVEITRLAKFTALEYAQQRKAAAKKLNIPVSMLDKVVQGERERLGLSGADDGKLQGSAVSFEEIEPWPEPVNGVELLGDIATTIRSHVVVSDFSRDISALWTVHTYLIRKFMISPKLSIRSAVKGCGKTTLLDVLSHLVFRALVTGSITKAALFRIIDMWHPTLLIDEVDSFVGDDEELRGMLNNSHRYDGAVVRTVGDEHEPRRFSIYAAVALSGIGGLVDTLADRSVTTDLQRRRPSEPITQLRIGRMEHLHTLQRRITRWVADHQERIADRDPKMPVGVHNREADNWHVLLAVADEAGGDWPERARKAAEQAHIAGANDDASWLELMLGDMRSIFAEKGKKVRDLFGVDQVVISSADLVKALLGLEARPWDEMGKSRKPLSQNRLARMLKPLGIAPKNVGPEDARVRGYILADFKEAFERYLAPEGASQPPIRPERDEIGTSDISKPHSLGNGCADVKCEKPNNDGLLGGCAVAKGGLDENARCDHCGGHASPANPLKPYNWPGRPDGVRLHPGCEAPFHDASPRASEPRPPQATNGSERDMRPCACCGKPGTAADRLRHGHWRPRRPEGDWLHASCIGPWQEGGWRRRV
jgi:putative DNA primase/helicase